MLSNHRVLPFKRAVLLAISSFPDAKCKPLQERIGGPPHRSSARGIGVRRLWRCRWPSQESVEESCTRGVAEQLGGFPGAFEQFCQVPSAQVHFLTSGRQAHGNCLDRGIEAPRAWRRRQAERRGLQVSDGLHGACSPQRSTGFTRWSEARPHTPPRRGDPAGRRDRLRHHAETRDGDARSCLEAEAEPANALQLYGRCDGS